MSQPVPILSVSEVVQPNSAETKENCINAKAREKTINHEMENTLDHGKHEESKLDESAEMQRETPVNSIQTNCSNDIDAAKLNKQTNLAPNYGVIPAVQAPSATASTIISPNSALVSTNTPSASSNKTPKLNGLKNRIIQRPPPLVLDKVSNFYDNELNGNLNTQAVASTNNATKNASNNQTLPNRVPQLKSLSKSSASNIAKQPASDAESRSIGAANGTNTANEKFWASLNENASRNKALANARASVNNLAQKVGSKETDQAQLQPNDTTDSTNTLGADLVIRHRNSSGSSHLSSGRFVSSVSSKKQERPKGDDNRAPSQACHTNVEGEARILRHHLQQRNALNLSNEQDENDGTNQSEHGGSVGGGGNLIGVDNSTPPAPSVLTINNSGEALSSASSSRPRSNNPFIDNDDEDDGFVSDSRVASRKQQVNHFHKRPASFIAATTTPDKCFKQPILFNNNNNPSQRQPYEGANYFNTKHQDGPIQSNGGFQSNHINHGTANDYDSIYVDDCMKSAANEAAYQQASGEEMFKYAPSGSLHRILSNAGKQQKNLAGKKVMEQQTISLDSQSAICRPLPSDTMQLPHWTEAIYELNNAIFDANSVSGGAENGQFIFITESGDIVLELDKVKVSGYTLVEFNELVESKQFHLLSAVQTKHSYGLTHNLNDYLNQSFPKNGADRDLQNSIRENIYRLTIPCTTRPPRPGEVNGVDYRFLTTDQFAGLNSAGVLLECGVYAGHYYGTLKPLCDLNILASHQSSNSSKQQAADSIGQNWDANHPAVELPTRREVSHNDRSDPVYENHESIHMYKQSSGQEDTRDSSVLMPINNYQAQDVGSKQNHHNINLPFELPLPPGWEKVADPAHGTYYIDHFTRRTQYERPYEVELTKGSMGFGFTLVEADNGMLLVRSIIQGGPAYLNGHIKPGDILLSAVGISVTGLQHTDVARLFAKFAVGDRVKLTFACSNFAPENIVPDEYVFSNGTNGDLAIAVNPNNAHNQLRLTALPVSNQSPHIMVVNQEFEYINVTLRRGDQGFGFTISDSMAGQRVRKIQNNDTCANLKQGDIIVSMNGEDITKLTHKEVVERLKNCPAGDDVRLTVKRKKRFRSKTPMAMHTNADGEYSLDSTPQRNCKTPSLDGLMLARPVDQNSKDLSRAYRPLFESQLCSDTQQGQFVASKLPPTQQSMLFPLQNINMPVDYAMTGLPIPCPVQLPEQFPVMDSQIYGTLPDASYSVLPNESHFAMSTRQVADQTVYGTIQHSLPVFANNQELSAANRLESIHSIDQTVRDDISNSAQPSERGSMTNGYHPNNITSIAPQSHQVNLNYHNLMTDPRFDIAARNPSSQNYPSFSQTNNFQSSSYHQLPMYCNTDMVNGHKFNAPNPVLPAKPAMIYPVAQNAHLTTNIYQDNYYANNEELASQPMRYNDLESNQAGATFSLPNEHLIQPMTQDLSQISLLDEQNSDDYEFHHVDLERDNSDSNWGIRLIGGAEVDRAISIGSIVFGGAASKNGLLKSGDEIISINQISVIGATHRHVVELISTCANRVTLVVRRKRFAEACDVVLTRNMDEGFGFVIISSGNCALIGRIIEGSPADRCKQLHVRDRIIAVNGSYITPNMRHPQIVSMIKECGSNLRLRIIPVDCYTVELIKNSQNDNFGFSIRGGSEYDGTPLYILRVAPNGLARDLLNVGDQILEINNIPTVGMTHHQAATIIKYSDPIVKLKLRRNYVTPASLLVDSPRELQKFNQVTAEMISVNQNTTPNMSQVSSSVVNENLSDAASSSNMLAGQLKFGSDVGSDNSVPASNTHNVTRIVSEQQQQQLSVSLPITLDERQQLASDERQQQSEQQSQQQTSSSSLPYGNQSQALYAT